MTESQVRTEKENAVAAASLISIQNCPDCNGRGVANIAATELPCPTCRADEFDAVMEAVGRSLK